MAKLTTKAQKIFAGDVSPNNVIAVFGSKKAGSAAYSSDPDTIQGLAAWAEGWSQAVITNSAPSIQDMNAFFYVVTRQLAYLFQGGVGEWNEAITYYTGSLVNDGLGTIYKSLVDDNLNNSLTDDTKWINYKSINARDVSALAYTVNNSDYVFTWPVGTTGPTGTSYNLPTAATGNIGRKFVIVDIHNASSNVSQTLVSNGITYLPDAISIIT